MENLWYFKIYSVLGNYIINPGKLVNFYYVLTFKLAKNPCFVSANGGRMQVKRLTDVC